MTEEQEKEQLMSELRDVAGHGAQWLQVVKGDAIRVALAEIERLTTENADLKNQLGDELQRVADFAILFEQAKLEEMRLRRRVNVLFYARLNGGALGRDDVKNEVIE